MSSLFDLPPMEKLKKFYRHVMENYPDRVVTDLYEIEVNSKSSFAPSPPFGFYNIKFILAHDTDFSFHFKVNPTGQRKFVSGAKLPKQTTPAITFYPWTPIEYIHTTMRDKLKSAMVAPSLHQRIMDLALNTARAYDQSRPPEHNCVVVNLSARISLRFDFEEPIMPQFGEDYCGAFEEYTVSHEIDSKTCSICLDDFISDHQSVSAPCGHKFHPDCINMWLAKSRFCPNCRKRINKARLVL